MGRDDGESERGAVKYPVWVPTLQTQHEKRQQKASEHPERERYPKWVRRMCAVLPVTKDVARAFIQEYEYLGDLGASTRASYGLFTPWGELLGVECFGVPPTDRLGKKLCPDNPAALICLERGACSPWAPASSAGRLIKGAIEQAADTYKWEVFIAYADENAGEIGGVYRGSGDAWLYLGRDVGRGGNRARVSVIRPGETVPVQTRKHRQAGLKTRAAAELAGWQFVMMPTKHVFVRFAGERAVDRRRYVEGKFKMLPWPTRLESSPIAGDV